jgi:lipopolysaccharide/colanic/teichoic acid biosynthesis glycosyltransferase
MHIKKGMKKHRFSPLLSWLWLLAGLAVFVCIHRVYFLPTFLVQFQGDLSMVKPLYWGGIACCLAVGWSMLSGRKLPYSNNFEVLLVTSLFFVCVLLFFLAATREFYSGTYLLTLECVMVFWFGMEVCFRNRFVTYRFIVLPSSIPLSREDFLEHDVVFWKEDDDTHRFDEVDAVVVDFTISLHPPLQKLLSQYQQIGMPVIPLSEFLENVWGRIPIGMFGGAMGPGNTPFRPYLLLKPLLERIIAFAGLLVTAPVVLAAALAVKMTSAGPILFCQQRVGRKGVPFTIYKLRTMRNGTDGPAGRDGIENDRDVTAIGRLLRRYHLDELPQLINVLKGDMALVGPRPETVEFTEVYKGEIPGYILRNQMLPGVTSWALIHQGHVHGVRDTAVKLSYDLFYLKHVSLFLDFYIIIKTVWIMVTGIEKLSSPNGLRVFAKK